MQAFWTEVQDFSVAISTLIGATLLEVFGGAIAEEKQDGSLVTHYDRWSDEQIRTAIQQTFPEHGILSEETLHVFPDSEWCWIIDPIDGTTNFTRGIPLWAISLGLLYRGVPVFGYVYLPTLGHRFHGFWAGDSGLEMTSGAFLNQQPIQVTNQAPSKHQFFSLCARSTDVLKNPFPCKIRMLGVATYNLLIVGAGYAVGAAEATPKVWDIAGVWPILQAAGATWTALDDRLPFPLVIGENYRDRAFPTLVTNRADLVPQFRPLVDPIIEP
jgi:myo-inositol-1(or 4)-monophosphatase